MNKMKIERNSLIAVGLVVVLIVVGVVAYFVQPKYHKLSSELEVEMNAMADKINQEYISQYHPIRLIEPIPMKINIVDSIPKIMIPEGGWIIK
jgi:hypothetical protein